MCAGIICPGIICPGAGMKCGCMGHWPCMPGTAMGMPMPGTMAPETGTCIIG
jgi:hypothetical protein